MSKLAPEGIAAAVGSAALSREDLGILGRIDEGVSVQTPDGRIVYANEAAVRLVNLVDNGVKYSPDGVRFVWSSRATVGTSGSP